jgi:hypothetical protein
MLPLKACDRRPRRMSVWFPCNTWADGGCRIQTGSQQAGDRPRPRRCRRFRPEQPRRHGATSERSAQRRRTTDMTACGDRHRPASLRGIHDTNGNGRAAGVYSVRQVQGDRETAHDAITHAAKAPRWKRREEGADRPPKGGPGGTPPQGRPRRAATSRARLTRASGSTCRTGSRRDRPPVSRSCCVCRTRDSVRRCRASRRGPCPQSSP